MTVTAVPTTSRSLSVLPFGTLLVIIGKYGDLDETPPWAVNIYALSPQGQRLWIADGIAKIGVGLSPDGRKVDYMVDEPAGESIWIANPDGTAAHRLTPSYSRGGDAVHYLSGYGWSANSREFAYMRRFKYAPEDNQLYIVDVATDTIRPVGGKGLIDASWNPKRAEEMLILPYETNQPCVFNTQTGECVALEGEIPRLRHSGWEVWGFTPNGEGFYLVREGMLAITGKKGQIQRQIHVNARIGDIRWSPDSQQLLFAIYDGQGLADIYVMGSQDTDWRKLVSRQVFHSSNGSAQPRISLGLWSPDNQWFTIFSRNQAGSGSELYVCNVNNGELRKVLIHEQNIYTGVWVP